MLEREVDPRLLLLPEEERIERKAGMMQRLLSMFLFFLALFITLNSVIVFILDKTCRDNYPDITAVPARSPQTLRSM